MLNTYSTAIVPLEQIGLRYFVGIHDLVSRCYLKYSEGNLLEIEKVRQNANETRGIQLEFAL